MSPSGVDPADGLTRWTRRHLGLLLAVAGRALPDPELALDVASEAIAKASATAPDDPAGALHGEARAALQALENVVRATRANGRVPRGERLRHRDPRPVTLAPEDRAAIVRLFHEPLDAGSLAEQFATVLARDGAHPAELRRIMGSGLVHRPDAPERRPADESPPA